MNTIQSKLQKVEEEYRSNLEDIFVKEGKFAVNSMVKLFRSHLLSFAKWYSFEVIGEDEKPTVGYPLAHFGTRNKLRRELREKVKEDSL